MKALAAGLAACCALNVGLRARLGPVKTDPVGVRLQADSAVEDAALFGLGMRRLAADLGLIRLLVYYGTPEEAGVIEEEPGSHPFTGRDHVERSWGGGRYPQIEARAERILDIDPGFTFAALYASGVLAFNLNRPDDALAVVRYALARDPQSLALKQYAAAIGFQRHGNAEEVIKVLAPTLSEPDCPTMIKNLVALLYWRTGQRGKAAALYHEILESSRDQGYRGLAKRSLRELQAGRAAPVG